MLETAGVVRWNRPWPFFATSGISGMIGTATATSPPREVYFGLHFFTGGLEMNRLVVVALVFVLTLSVPASHLWAGDAAQSQAQKQTQTQSQSGDCVCDGPNSDADCPQNSYQNQSGNCATGRRSRRFPVFVSTHAGILWRRRVDCLFLARRGCPRKPRTSPAPDETFTCPGPPARLTRQAGGTGKVPPVYGRSFSIAWYRR